jgi:hypothetical protein
MDSVNRSFDEDEARDRPGHHRQAPPGPAHAPNRGSDLKETGVEETNMTTFRFQICPRDGAPFEIGVQAPHFGDAFRAVTSQYPNARIYPLGEA